MTTISVKRAGFAFGAACGLLYLGCVFVMLTVPHDAVVRFGARCWRIQTESAAKLAAR